MCVYVLSAFREKEKMGSVDAFFMQEKKSYFFFTPIHIYIFISLLSRSVLASTRQKNKMKEKCRERRPVVFVVVLL
jgi:hypothetical protein